MRESKTYKLVFIGVLILALLLVGCNKKEGKQVVSEEVKEQAENMSKAYLKEKYNVEDSSNRCEYAPLEEGKQDTSQSEGLILSYESGYQVFVNLNTGFCMDTKESDKIVEEYNIIVREITEYAVQRIPHTDFFLSVGDNTSKQKVWLEKNERYQLDVPTTLSTTGNRVQESLNITLFVKISDRGEADYQDFADKLAQEYANCNAVSYIRVVVYGETNQDTVDFVHFLKDNPGKWLKEFQDTKKGLVQYQYFDDGNFFYLSKEAGRIFH